jgi:hypothetical protein
VGGLGTLRINVGKNKPVLAFELREIIGIKSQITFPVEEEICLLKVRSLEKGNAWKRH